MIAYAPALRLYRRLGFTEIGRRPGYYSGGAPGDALVLRAALAPPAMVSKSAETDYEKPVRARWQTKWRTRTIPTQS